MKYTICLFLVSLVSTTYMQGQFIPPGMPQQNFTSPPQSNFIPPAGPTVSEEDILKLLEDEELQKQLFEEIEQELAKKSPEELAELEKLGRQMLIDMGLNPDTMEPLGPPTPTPPVPPAPVIPPIEEKPFEISPVALRKTTDVQKTLTKIIEHLGFLSAKASSSAAEDQAPALAARRNILNRLLAYAKIINKPQHHERLTTSAHVSLFSSIEELAFALEQYEPNIILHELEEFLETEDPYEILGLDIAASPSDIEAAYKRLARRRDPKEIEQALRKQKASEKDIQRAIKDAKIALQAIEHAYEQLKDPQLRKQIDRARSTRLSMRKEVRIKTEYAVQRLLAALTKILDQDRLFEQLEEFLKKYEPKELEQRKELEKAETERRKEQLTRAQQRAIPSPGSTTPQTAPSITPPPPYSPPGIFDTSVPSFPSEPTPISSVTTLPVEEKPKPTKYEPSRPLKEPEKDKDKDKKPEKERELDKDKDKKPKKEKEEKDVFTLMRELEADIIKTHNEFDAESIKRLTLPVLDSAFLDEKIPYLQKFGKKLLDITHALDKEKNTFTLERVKKHWQAILSDAKTEEFLHKLSALDAHISLHKARAPEFFDRLTFIIRSLLDITNMLEKKTESPTKPGAEKVEKKQLQTIPELLTYAKEEQSILPFIIDKEKRKRRV